MRSTVALRFGASQAEAKAMVKSSRPSSNNSKNGSNQKPSVALCLVLAASLTTLVHLIQVRYNCCSTCAAKFTCLRACFHFEIDDDSIPCICILDDSTLNVAAGNERLAIACGDCNVRVWQMDHPRYVYKSQSLWKSIQSKVLSHFFQMDCPYVCKMFPFISFFTGHLRVLEPMERRPHLFCYK